MTIALSSSRPLPVKTPLAPVMSNTAPPPAAPALMASWMEATSSPPALSASSGTVVASQVDQPTGTRPKAKPHMATIRPSSSARWPKATIISARMLIANGTSASVMRRLRASK